MNRAGSDELFIGFWGMKPPIMCSELTSASCATLLNWLDFSTTTSIIDAKILGTLLNSSGCVVIIGTCNFCIHSSRR